MVNITIHKRGILNLQKGLCPFKDTGPGEILAFILNKVQRFNSPISDKDVPALPRLFLDSQISDEWCRANIFPIYKRREKIEPSNAGLSPLVNCRIMEHVVHSAVIDHFNLNNLS